MQDINEWHRRFLNSEWSRRRQMRFNAGLLKKMRAQIRVQEQKLRRARKTIRSQELAISAQKNLSRKFKLPTCTSFRLCKARRDELCPLSLAPIRSSTLACAPGVVYNPARPRHTCTELACGHRFSSMWIVYHFVTNSTFRCPVCANGPKHFRFILQDLPQHLQPIFRPALA